MKRNNRCRLWTHDNWPEPWCAAWKVAIEPGDAFKVGGPATKLSKRTVANDEMAFGRYREFLCKEGRTDSYPAPALDNLRAFTLHLSETIAPYSVLGYLKQVAAAVRLMVPSVDLHDMNMAIERFGSEVQPVRKSAKNVRNPIELIAIGKAIMADADACPERTKRIGLAFRNGAVITAATYCPLRLRNWLMMRIGVHLNLETGQVIFHPWETKRKKRLEFHLPPEVLDVLRRYVDVYRSLLLDPDARDEGYLWPGRKGGASHRNALGIAVKSAILKRTRQHFNFHLFRHTAATFISETTPERTRMAAGVLHHARVSTTDKYYIHGQRRRAFKTYQSGVRDLVAKGRRRKTRATNKKKAGARSRRA